MPDSAVLATGPIYSEKTGKGKIVNVLEVLRDQAEVGEKVVVSGNRKPGIRVALYLAKQKKR